MTNEQIIERLRAVKGVTKVTVVQVTHVYTEVEDDEYRDCKPIYEVEREILHGSDRLIDFHVVRATEGEHENL